jgi:hypothetical protein
MNITTKVKEQTKPKNTLIQNLSESRFVGLSYSPYLTALETQKYHLEQKVFKWGEMVSRVVLTTNAGVNATISKPPKNEGERVSNGLTKRGKTRLRRGARLFQHIAETQKGFKGHTSMVTLTFGKWYPDDKGGKKLLDTFIKRMKRKVKNKDFYYIWVAERQKRGAIHFHILTPHYFSKKFINDSWNEIVNNHLGKIDLGDFQQTLYPNVIAVYNAGGYMVKYCQKEGENIIGNGYNMSQKTSEMIKPELYSQIIAGNELQNTLNELGIDNKLVYENEIVSIFWNDNINN